MTGILALLVGLVAVFAALALAAVVIGDGIRQRSQVRASLATVGEFHITGTTAPRPENIPFDERVIVPLFKRATSVGRRITPTGQAEKYQKKIELAGVSQSWNTDRVLAFKVIGIVAGVPAGWLISTVLGMNSLLTIALVVAGGVFGYYGIDLWLSNTATHRKADVLKALPDAIDMMTIAVEAGMAFDGALSEVAKNTKGPLAEETFRTLQEMQLGVGRGDALQNMADRIGVKELSAFVSSVGQADKYGVPISSVLRVQSQEMRVKRRQRAEEKAQKVPIKILFPLGLCILPAMFIVILGPAAISIYEVLGNR